ncbi:MAG: hypothetical protein NTX03_10510 [Bacteroidetes bacterium]|nr:hypothetical protein [Bacteroidota bacterium]
MSWRCFLVLGIGIPALITSCRNPFSTPENAIAKVHKTYLYEEDLKGIFPKGTSKEDSQRIRQNFISSWVKEQLITQKAEEDLTDDVKNKDKEVKEYYSSLLRYEYERMVLSKKLDTTVTEQEIRAYYFQNKKNFELKRNIVKLFYVKLPASAPDKNKVRKWLRNPNPAIMPALQRYAEQYAANFTIDTTSWFYFDDIAKEIPIIESYNPEHFIRNNDFVELKDAQYYYLINVVANKIKDDVSPLALEMGKIKSIIINKRQVTLLQQLENKIFKEGTENNLYEIYQKNK